LASKLQITQFRSANGSNRPQRETLRSLGVGRIGQSAEQTDSPQIRGMIDAVRHLVRVEGGEEGKS
jgi:large subunit ribosomal protein L30